MICLFLLRILNILYYMLEVDGWLPARVHRGVAAAAGLLAEAARVLELLHAAGLAGLPPALSLARRLELVRVFLAAHARGRDSIALDLVPVELATPPLLRLLTRLPEPIPSIVAEYAALSPAEPASRVVEPLVQHAATDPGRPVFVSMDGSVPAMYRQCN